MKLRTIVASVVVCSLMLGSQAFAHTTIFGGTGLIFNPTAGVLSKGQYSAQISYAQEKPFGTKVRGLFYSAAASIAPRLELGVGVQDVKITGGGVTFFDSSSAGAGLKYQVREETDTTPATALGVQFDNLFKRGTAYLVCSRTLHAGKGGGGNGNGAWRVHGGVRFDDVDASRTATGSNESEFTFFGGIEAPISDRVRFMGEFQSRDKALAFVPFTATLHVNLSESATLFGGMSRIGVGNDTGWIFGLNWGFGKGG